MSLQTVLDKHKRFSYLKSEKGDWFGCVVIQNNRELIRAYEEKVIERVWEG